MTRQSYDHWHERYGVDSGADTPWHRLVLAHLDRRRDLSGRRVLEIACGRGGFAATLVRLAQPPPRIVAADFSDAAVRKGKAFAEAKALTSINWEVADAASLAHADRSFDTVISCETLEHLPRPRATLAEFARVLKPGGRLLLTTPNYLSAMGLYRGYARLRGRPFTEEGQPINRFVVLPLTMRWVVAAGLTVTAVEAVGHYIPLPGRPPVELASLRRVRALRWLALHSLIVAEKHAT